jgi:hypothetical protein
MNSNIKFLGVDSTKVDLTERKDSRNNVVTEYYTASELREYFQNNLSEVSFSGDYNDLINLPAYINYFDFSSNLTTTISNLNTWVKLNTNTTSLFSRDGLVHTNNRVTNTSSTKVFKIEGIVSVSSGNNNEVHAAFFKNGQLYPCSEQETVTASNGRSSAVPFHCVIELNTNDYIEVWVKNKNNSNNIILDNINVIVSEL